MIPQRIFHDEFPTCSLPSTPHRRSTSAYSPIYLMPRAALARIGGFGGCFHPTRGKWQCCCRSMTVWGGGLNQTPKTPKTPSLRTANHRRPPLWIAWDALKDKLVAV